MLIVFEWESSFGAMPNWLSQQEDCFSIFIPYVQNEGDTQAYAHAHLSERTSHILQQS